MSKMDLIKKYFSVLFLLCFTINDVLALTATIGVPTSPIVYGSNPFDITCTYSGEFGTLYVLEIKKDTNLILSMEFLASSSNATIDASISDRVTFHRPGQDQTARLSFSDTRCTDAASYHCEVTYFLGGSQTESSPPKDITLKVKPSFGLDNRNVTINPSGPHQEGDDVTFSCEDDVGKNPAGAIKWFYYMNDAPTVPIPVTDGITDDPIQDVTGNNMCSSSQRSSLAVKLTREYNNFLVRCTVQQDTTNADGDGHMQTNNIPIMYAPLTASITRTPDQPAYTEDQDQVKLSCNTDANPAASYYWILPSTNETQDGFELLLSIAADNGTYTCVAYNTIGAETHTINQTVDVIVVEQTTPPPTTTPNSSPVTTPSPGGNTQPSTDDGGSTTTIIIIVCCLVGVIIIVIVIVLVWIKLKRSTKEIEEPPEKPRKPDLVSSDHMKNNTGLNSSFNNSFDSTSDIKPRNEDGLLYIDLQFDDKPRSRRPIQVYENTNNGNPAYADIAMPRV